MIIDPTRPSFRTGLTELIRPLPKKQHRSIDQDEESKGDDPQDRGRDKHLHHPRLADNSADPDDRGDVDAEKDCDRSGIRRQDASGVATRRAVITARVIVPIAPAVRAWIAALCGMSGSMTAKPSKAAPSTSQP